MPKRDFLQTETLRLVALQGADLLDTPIESRFNRIVRLARQALRVRAATIGLFDNDREWIKAADGWERRELPLAQSLAAALGNGTGPVIVQDTHEDVRCAQNPLVTHAPKVRFCAVYPLRDRRERVIGAFSAYDTAPRDSSSANTLATLNDVGYFVQRELLLVDAFHAQELLLLKLGSARRQSMLDELTRLWNRRGALQLLAQAIADGASQRHDVGVCLADLDRFKEINDTHGHAAGDMVLKRTATALVDSVRPGDMVCRIGGEEFLLILPGVTTAQLPALLERVRQHVMTQTFRINSTDVRVTLSLGGCVQPPDESTTIEDLLQRVDGALYGAKSAGRNMVVIS